MKITIEIAPGELIDRLSILEIKLTQITDPAKLANIRYEYDLTLVERQKLLPGQEQLEPLAAELKSINQEIWRIEDDIRERERLRDFGAKFVALARSVYQTDDRRAAVKRRINDLLHSAIVEEKSYTAY